MGGQGGGAVDRARRRVASLRTTPKQDQCPEPGSREEQTLQAVYAYYDGNKSRFEALAAVVAQRVIAGSGVDYTHGWVTRGSSDRGIDFVARIDLGHGFGSAPVIVLGQAKCESPTSPTGGNHIARTVARLRRGWVGVYVTTSYFSRSVQEEVLEDRYPIVLVHGLRIAQEVQALMSERGHKTVSTLLDAIDETFETARELSDPEELLTII